MENNTWRHFCTHQEKIMEYPINVKTCFYCKATQELEEEYQGLYFLYPRREYLRWPEYMQYYYRQNKKSS